MTVDELIEQLREVAHSGQGDFPVVNDNDQECSDITVDTDADLGAAVVLDFERNPRGHYDPDD